MVAHTGGLFGHATPGPWYGAYREDWHLRHSEACAAGALEIGHFPLGSIRRNVAPRHNSCGA
jgi:hypothetical protein